MMINTPNVILHLETFLQGVQEKDQAICTVLETISEIHKLGGIASTYFESQRKYAEKFSCFLQYTPNIFCKDKLNVPWTKDLPRAARKFGYEPDKTTFITHSAQPFKKAREVGFRNIRIVNNSCKQPNIVTMGEFLAMYQ
jgi:hypothetical protein